MEPLRGELLTPGLPRLAPGGLPPPWTPPTGASGAPEAPVRGGWGAVAPPERLLAMEAPARRSGGR
eukprot:499585-Alexandrium_andersonii.AAC.1